MKRKCLFVVTLLSSVFFSIIVSNEAYAEYDVEDRSKYANFSDPILRQSVLYGLYGFYDESIDNPILKEDLKKNRWWNSV